MAITISCDFCNESVKVNDMDLVVSLHSLVQSNNFGTMYIGSVSFTVCEGCMAKVNDIIIKAEENKTDAVRKSLEELKSKV